MTTDHYHAQVCFEFQDAAGWALCHDFQLVPEHSKTCLHGLDDWEKASGHCTSGAPVGLSQDSMADPGARRRYR